MRLLPLIFILMVQTAMANEEQKADPSSMMRELRLMMLKSNPEDYGLSKENSGTEAYGIIMDFPIGEDIASVVAFSTGDASLYTTSTFGVMGGIGHESVRNAAKEFVRASEEFVAGGVNVDVFPYPEADTVFFYIITFDGVLRIEAKMSDIESGKSSLGGLFGVGQDVLTQLRISTEKKD